MTLVGCDLHTRKQQVAVLDTETGEMYERHLSHAGDAVEQFYRALLGPVTVGIESTGYALWFHELMQRLGHTLLVGEAAKIRAMVVRKTKTDRRDALHLLDLLKHERFPLVWIPDPATRDLRALVTHRMRLVRMRTMVKNGLHAIAMNRRLTLGPSLWSQRGLAQLQGLALAPHTTQRRDESLQLLTWLTARIEALDDRVAAAAQADPGARLLLSHPGVGPLTALTTVVVLGPVARFPDSKHVVSYTGLAPAVHASADTCRLGQITKQGSPLLRFVLGQAGLIAAHAEVDLKRHYRTLLRRRGRPKAIVAIARKLLVRLYIMLRDQIDYEEFRRRGRTPRGQEVPPPALA
jgi:transposase